MNAAKLFKLLRLSLGGAVLGVAAVGLLASAFGFDKSPFDIVGAAVGGLGSAAWVKVAHVI